MLLQKLLLFSNKYRKTLIFAISIILLLNFCLYSFDQIPTLTYAKFENVNFRDKYLQSLKEIDDSTSENFTSKWSALEYLDELINEPIQNSTFENSPNPFQLLKSFEDEDDTFHFNDLSLLDKIKFYTDSILSNSNFTFHPIQDKIYKDALYPQKFVNKRMKKWEKIKEQLSPSDLKKLGINDDWFHDIVEKARQSKLDHNLISINEMKNTFTHLKFFSNFFLKPEHDNLVLNSDHSNDYIEQCSIFSSYLFDNWLSGELPIFKKFDRDLKEEILDLHPHKIDNCFVKMLHANLKGKGIVFTTGNGLIHELSGLLALLRITGNTYPIQIFYNNDLSDESIRTIMDVSVSPNMKLPKSLSPDDFKVPENPPPLDITFVDFSNTIASDFRGHFKRFGMKLLAYLFNTYEDMVMLDTDTVPVEPMDNFFESPKYTSTKAYFFKDRNADSFIYEGIVDYMKSFLNYDDEVHYLNLPRVTYETLHNRFFSGASRHFMESGVFVVNRKEKFDGVLATVILQMFTLFSGSFHGEKEFIWLAQEIMGQPYTFNENAAIAIGELTVGRGSITQELCSTHPAHIDNDNKTLLWFNSGFLHCKKTSSYKNDITNQRHKDKTLLELKHLYEGPLHITHGLIPPPGEYSYNAHIDNEPKRGWTMTNECSRYLWCSYNIIGGGTNPKIPNGEIISFEPHYVNTWSYMGRVWVDYFNIADFLMDKDTGYQGGAKYDDIELDEHDMFVAKPDEEEEDKGK